MLSFSSFDTLDFSFIQRIENLDEALTVFTPPTMTFCAAGEFHMTFVRIEHQFASGFATNTWNNIFVRLTLWTGRQLTASLSVMRVEFSTFRVAQFVVVGHVRFAVIVKK